MKQPVLADKKKCTGCMVCVDTCNQKALLSYVDDDGHYYVKLLKDACIGCLACEKACPVVNDINYGQSEYADFHASWNKNVEERKQSASGGVFAAMAHYILDQGGIVVGASTENVCDVRHVVIKSIDYLHKLQGSKYTQSSTEGIYLETYQFLKEGKQVLFSGTGCQVAALLSFLKRKKYTGELMTVDLICGGVPSKLLLQSFVSGEPYQVKCILSYRTKDTGWKPRGFRYNMKVEDMKGNIHDYTGKRNLVTTGFCSELTNRYSCYKCNFLGEHRLSDFTIGDLWGDKMHPAEHYNGLSLLIAHNDRARTILGKMGDYLTVEKCDENSAKEFNSRLRNCDNRAFGYTLERRYMRRLFKCCNYRTLQKIYASDYPSYSPWMLLKIIRKLYIKIL